MLGVDSGGQGSVCHAVLSEGCSRHLSALAALVCSRVPCPVCCSVLTVSACAACRLADAAARTADCEAPSYISSWNFHLCLSICKS